MKNINWKVRLRNQKWVVGFVSQLLIIVQMVVAGLNQTGAIAFEWTEDINVWILGLVNAVLIALAMMGIVQDPTTKNYSDSEQAKTYAEPK